MHPQEQAAFVMRSPSRTPPTPRDPTLIHTAARKNYLARHRPTHKWPRTFYLFCLPKLTEVILFDLFTPVDKQSQGSKVRPTVLGKPEPLLGFFDPLFKPGQVGFQYGPIGVLLEPAMQIIHEFIHRELIN